MSVSLQDQSARTREPETTSYGATAVYIGPPERRSFAWLHAPVAPERDCAVVLCGPLGQESTGVHRAMRHWATGFAAAGFPALRMDYHGLGDSAGGYHEPDRLRAWIASVGDAIQFARNVAGVERVAVAAIGIGAAFAIAAAAERGDVSELILWAPVPTGRAYLREGRAFTRLMAPGGFGELPEGHEQIGGFVLTHETVEQLTAFDPLAGDAKINAAALVIPREESARDNPFIEKLSAAGATVERRPVAGYGDMMLDTHQALVPRDVIDASADWLRSRTTARRAAKSPALQVDARDRELFLRVTDAAPDTQGVVERPIHFGAAGELFGIVSRPAGATRRKTGVLLSNAGSVARVGPNRFYVTLARIWSALGYTVLRMDLGGLGDSAIAPESPENHPYPSYATDNIAQGVAALRAQGVERVVVGGLCSGAHTAFHAGLSVPAVDGLIMINPIVFYWKESDALDVASWTTYVETRHYQNSVKQWKSWARLLRGRVDVGHVARTGARRASELLRAKQASFLRRFREAGDEDAARDLDRIVRQGTDVLLLFSTGEPGLDYLRVNFARELRRLEKHPAFSLQELEDANHTFTSLGSRIRASAIMTAHLLAKHP
jgi:pimeloyl-ACP methyl ester carboxylesterase